MTTMTPSSGLASVSLIDTEMIAVDWRGLRRFHHPGGVQVAAQALASAYHVMLTTGFNVMPGMAETDGPVGAVALARALLKLGKHVTLVTDTINGRIVRAAMATLEHTEDIELVAFDAPLNGCCPVEAAKALLSSRKPDALFSIEVPGRSRDGSRRNMHGKKIDAFNAHLDCITLDATTRNIATFGVGDGGNEVGMGSLATSIPAAMNSQPFASTVCVSYPVTAWNSNLGAEAVAASMLCAANRLNELHAPAEQSQMILAAMRAGAVDGITRSNLPGTTIRREGRVYVSGVDGFSIEVHQRQLERLKRAVSRHFA